jgi:2-polyprenyl-3-methyl-5-hydroxy-6-metoxy-1,4-benzoquinol methylase
MASPALAAPTAPHRPCPVCGGTRTRALHRRPERSILRCACGLVFIDPLPSASEVAAREGEAFRGELLEETRAMFDAYGRGFREDDPVVRGFARHVATLGRLAAGRRLLDVGVGTGLLVHLARRAGWDAAGVDICAEAAARAEREFGVPVAVGDFLTAELAGGWDAITMADVLEHSRDPRAFLRRAWSLLAPGGVLYVGVPNHRSLVYLAGDLLGRVPGTAGLVDKLYVPNHYQYFTPATLATLVGEVGFVVTALERENSHIGRYELAPHIRVGLATLLAASRVVGMESRLALFARRPVA